MGPIPNDIRRAYYQLRKRIRRCVGCSDLLLPQHPRVYCDACSKRQADWQRRHRRKRSRQAKAYRERKRARLLAQNNETRSVCQ